MKQEDGQFKIIYQNVRIKNLMAEGLEQVIFKKNDQKLCLREIIQKMSKSGDQNYEIIESKQQIFLN